MVMTSDETTQTGSIFVCGPLHHVFRLAARDERRELGLVASLAQGGLQFYPQLLGALPSENWNETPKKEQSARVWNFISPLKNTA